MNSSPQETVRAPDTWAISVGLFLLALLVHTLFAAGGPDGDWPHSVHYKGDAFVWLRQVRAERAGATFEAGVPMRPPGMAWLIGALWDGSEGGVASVKLAWRIMGAATVSLLFLTLSRSFARSVALGASCLLAFGNGALVIAGSLNNETPYLLLVVLSMLAQPASRAVAHPGRSLVWGGLHAAACLVRVEHALFFALLAAYLAVTRPTGRTAREKWIGLGAGTLGFVLALVPWHVTLWARVDTFNRGEIAKDPAALRAVESVERATRGIRWREDARAAAEQLPGSTRRSARGFIAATVQQRGEDEVSLEDIGILEEAFGYHPEAIAAHPFISSYGPLNFYLANNPRATPGFSRAGLDRPPPLRGGAERYPPHLVQGLPPQLLALEYPPHLEVFNDGYALGLRWIADHPLGWLALSGRKLGVFWRGASLGFGGYDVPLGPSGTRRAVDLVTPEHWGATLWRGLLAVIVLAGLVRGAGRRDTRAALTPWLLYAASKFVVAAFFFGYARQGVLILPVVDLGLALAASYWLGPRLGRRGVRMGLVLSMGLLVLEGMRAVRGVDATIDGIPVTGTDPIPADDHGDRTIGF